MRRCPCCNARLSAAPFCPRCGADLSRVFGCERLAKLWLSVALQTLSAGRAALAVAAVERSLSFKQTQQARLLRDFLVQHQYRALYEHLGQKQWQQARQTIVCLAVLLGDNETLSRFTALIEHLSAKEPAQNNAPSVVGGALAATEGL